MDDSHGLLDEIANQLRNLIPYKILRDDVGGIY